MKGSQWNSYIRTMPHAGKRRLLHALARLCNSSQNVFILSCHHVNDTRLRSHGGVHSSLSDAEYASGASCICAADGKCMRAFFMQYLD
jgi:hypothetical protein